VPEYVSSTAFLVLLQIALLLTVAWRHPAVPAEWMQAHLQSELLWLGVFRSLARSDVQFVQRRSAW